MQSKAPDYICKNIEKKHPNSDEFKVYKQIDELCCPVQAKKFSGIGAGVWAARIGKRCFRALFRAAIINPTEAVYGS